MAEKRESHDEFILRNMREQAVKDRMKKAGFKDSEIGDTRLAKGGRAGYKMGGKCKLATKGKGRAYGKNS